jgi:hypothetical protein
MYSIVCRFARVRLSLCCSPAAMHGEEKGRLRAYEERLFYTVMQLDAWFHELIGSSHNANKPLPPHPHPIQRPLPTTVWHERVWRARPTRRTRSRRIAGRRCTRACLRQEISIRVSINAPCANRGCPPMHANAPVREQHKSESQNGTIV